MSEISIFAPAKLNLFLAVTGRRADGFHELVSLVVKLDFGDTLKCEVSSPKTEVGFALSCDDPAVPVDESNLVLKAARAFAEASTFAKATVDKTAGKRAIGGARFVLEKRIPIGAGLGGGSSDGAAALRALNQLANNALSPAWLTELAAQLGSDCPLFLHDGPIVMRGRGEKVSPLSPAAAARLRGRRVLVFKPAFGIATPWAYAQLAAAAPQSYLPADQAEARFARWRDDAQAPAEEVLFNNMEPPAFAKYLALPTLLERLRGDFGLEPRMSGSGSACFALLREDVDAAPIVAAVRAAWGESAFVVEARIA